MLLCQVTDRPKNTILFADSVAQAPFPPPSGVFCPLYRGQFSPLRAGSLGALFPCSRMLTAGTSKVSAQGRLNGLFAVPAQVLPPLLQHSLRSVGCALCFGLAPATPPRAYPTHPKKGKGFTSGQARPCFFVVFGWHCGSAPPRGVPSQARARRRIHGVGVLIPSRGAFGGGLSAHSVHLATASRPKSREWKGVRVPRTPTPVGLGYISRVHGCRYAKG